MKLSDYCQYPAAEETNIWVNYNFILLLTDARYNYAAHIVLYQPFYNKIVFLTIFLIIAIIITFFFSLDTKS